MLSYSLQIYEKKNAKQRNEFIFFLKKGKFMSLSMVF